MDQRSQMEKQLDAIAEREAAKEAKTLADLQQENAELREQIEDLKSELERTRDELEDYYNW